MHCRISDAAMFSGYSSRFCSSWTNFSLRTWWCLSSLLCDFLDIIFYFILYFFVLYVSYIYIALFKNIFIVIFFHSIVMSFNFLHHLLSLLIYFSLTCLCYAPKHQSKFIIGENLLSNKLDSDSELTYCNIETRQKAAV